MYYFPLLWWLRRCFVHSPTRPCSFLYVHHLPTTERCSFKSWCPRTRGRLLERLNFAPAPCQVCSDYFYFTALFWIFCVHFFFFYLSML